MPLIRSANLKVGMLVEEDIFSAYGSVLVNAGDYLDERDIEKIILHNVKFVKIATESEEATLTDILFQVSQSVDKQVLENLTETYEEKTADVEELFSQVSDENDQINIDESLTYITDDIIDSLGDQKSLFKYIKLMKKAAPSVYTHSLNVSLLCDLFATLLGYSTFKKQELVLAGMLHDIGKAELGLDIQFNTLNMDNLSPEDLQKYRKHSILSYRLLLEKGLSKDICLGVLMHHEAEQGTGFPTGAKWSQIHEYAKIIAIANYYDHLTFSGDKRSDINPFAVIKLLEKIQYDKFDINFMAKFLKRLATYYHGEWVELTSGEVGQIVFINKNDLAHPIVKIGNALIDLSREEEIDIAKVL